MTHLPLRSAVAPLTQPGKAPSSLLNGLVAYWKMDEANGQRNDSGPNALHLSIATNSPGSTTGKVGNAATFVAASSQGLQRTSEALLQPNASGFSICGWVNTVAGTAGDQWGKDTNANPNRQFLMEIFNGTGPPQFFVWDTSNTNRTVTWGSSLTVGTWYFIACRYNSSRQPTISVNAATAVSATALPGALNTTGTGAFQIGRRGSTFMNGNIDEVGYWSRELTDAEVTTLYNSGNGVTYPFS